MINGGNDLLALWLEINRESRRKNLSPENVRNIYERQFNSPDKLLYARIEVMTYGWWNCANDFIEYDQDDDRYQREFKKLFTRVKTIGCDEP